jgi:acetyltransferase-like isoleucine patch superfamily enzyme
MNKFDTPILLIAFNRPKHLVQLLISIKRIKPLNFFVFCDGPREDVLNDIAKCSEVRKIIVDSIDWECNLRTNFQDSNYGCGKGPSLAISWFFDQVEEGIILEDDSIPNIDFYFYMEELLDYYRYSDEIMAITGTNFQPKQRSNGSYYFSMQNGCFCSWATWKKSWLTFDYYLTNVTEVDLVNSLMYYKVTTKEIKYWLSIFRNVKVDRLGESCWDYQFMFAIWLNKGKTIAPNYNLITNIGFDSEATHTDNPNDPMANMLTKSILPIKHPSKIQISRDADLFYHKSYYQPDEFGLSGFKNTIILNNRKLRRNLVNLCRSYSQKILIRFFPELSKLKNSTYNFEFLKSYSENAEIGKNVNLECIYTIIDVQIGKGTYISQNSIISKTSIGNYCSIGPNFLCGWGVHPTNGISTSPMFYSTKEQNGISLSKYDKIEERKVIKIGNDVFIGANVTVLDGVTIGDGAVIGAGAVVSKNIPPYAIAVGCPINIVRYRFDQKEIDSLLKIRWWEFPDDQLEDVEKMFFDVDAFIEKYAK